MKANKTQPTPQSVQAYIEQITDVAQRDDAVELARLASEATGAQPVMWGTAIIGFGTYHYVYDSGREGDTPAFGFAVRKQALTLYGLFHHDQTDESIALAKQLGTHSHGKGCLYIKKLSDVDTDILKTMIKNAYLRRENTTQK